MTNVDPDSKLIDDIQRETFAYFMNEANESNGLVADKTKSGSPASIAAVGLALSSYPIGVERGYISRERAIQRTLATLQFFHNSDQSADPDATGYKGFFYHFLDMKTGKRVWQCGLSTIDTAYLLSGMLTAASYFNREIADEQEIRTLADTIYRKTDWEWAQNGGDTVSLGWKPETGFLQYRWEGYDEALILYVLGLGSPTHPLPPRSYTKWTSTYKWKSEYGYDYLFSGPMFTHQTSHLWIDFRGIQDEYMRGKGSDYFENSRRATYVQREYAIRNPGNFYAYGSDCWGITASDGPGPNTRVIEQRKREFYGYEARGVPDSPDDGSIAPWAVLASLPFAPEIVLPAVRYFEALKLREERPYGFKATFNATFSDSPDPGHWWKSPYYFGLNQGPIVIMIDNYRSGTIWRLMRRCGYLIEGLRRAGFTGGWLEELRSR